MFAQKIAKKTCRNRWSDLGISVLSFIALFERTVDS